MIREANEIGAARSRAVGEEVNRSCSIADTRSRPTDPGRVRAGAEIERDYPAGEEIHMVCVLKGGFVFMSDLVRDMSTRVTMDFIAVSSYGAGTQVLRRGSLPEGPRHQPRKSPRHRRRRHRRYRPDAEVPAGDPAQPRAEDPADGVPAEQAVATQGRSAGRLHRLHDRGSVRGRLRARLRGEVSQPPAHRRPAGISMKKFDIITESGCAHARLGATVELAEGGHVTPLAKDTLAERRVTVVAGRIADRRCAADDLAPTADIRRVAIGNDHTGIAMKTAIRVSTCGAGHRRPRPWHRHDRSGGLSRHRGAVARTVARGEADAGIVIDGAGHRIRDRGQQDQRHPRRDVHRRDDRALLARAQRRQRDDAGLDSAAGQRGRAPHRRHLDGTADARGALHPALAQDRAVSNRIQSSVLNPQDLQRLVEIITEEVVAAQRAATPAGPCSCHAVRATAARTGCARCPDAGATRLGLHATGGAPAGVVGRDRPHPAQGRRHARRKSRSCAAKPRSSALRRSVSTRRGSRPRRRSCAAPASVSARSSAFRSARRRPT